MMRSFLVTVMMGMSLFSGTGRAGEAIFVRVQDVDKGSGSLVVPVISPGSCIFCYIDGVLVPNPGLYNYSLKDIKVYTGIGKPLETDEVMKTVKPGSVMLFVRRGDKINFEFLFSFTKDTLIVIMPSNQEINFLLKKKSSLEFLVQKMVEPVFFLGRFVGEFGR
jgi:hypothetical protein